MLLPLDTKYWPGKQAEDVFWLQDRLIVRGMLSTADRSGIYDEETSDAVRRFQTVNGLPQDGIASPKTLELLNATHAEEGNANNAQKPEESQTAAAANPPTPPAPAPLAPPATSMQNTAGFADPRLEAIRQKMEQKLSPDALRAVRQIGAVMAAVGVNEAPLDIGSTTSLSSGVGMGVATQKGAAIS